MLHQMPCYVSTEARILWKNMVPQGRIMWKDFGSVIQTIVLLLFLCTELCIGINVYYKLLITSLALADTFDGKYC